jgi:hypothetical protein
VTSAIWVCLHRRHHHPCYYYHHQIPVQKPKIPHWMGVVPTPPTPPAHHHHHHHHRRHAVEQPASFLFRTTLLDGRDRNVWAATSGTA